MNYKVSGLLLLGAVGVCSPTLRAQSYDYLTFAYGGVEKSFSMSSLKKLTFTDGQVVAVTAEGEVSMPQHVMERMFFSATPTNIRPAVAGDNTALAYDALSGCLRINGGTAAQSLRIFTVNGMLVRELTVAAGGDNVSLTGLPKGIYIAKLNDITLKFSK